MFMPNSTKLLCPWDFQGKSTEVGCHFLLQGTFPTQGLSPDLSYCRQTHYCLTKDKTSPQKVYPSQWPLRTPLSSGNGIQEKRRPEVSLSKSQKSSRWQPCERKTVSGDPGQHTFSNTHAPRTGQKLQGI